MVNERKWKVAENGNVWVGVDSTDYYDPEYGAADHSVGIERRSICTTHGTRAREHARLIVRAVNAHVDLVDALRNLLDEAFSMNADLRKIGRGRNDDGAHPDCPIDVARALLVRIEGE